MDKFTCWAQKEYKIGSRIIATMIAGSVFVFAIPYFLLVLSNSIDKWLHMSRVHLHYVNNILGSLFIVTGLFFAVWSATVQVFKVRGTPLPMMPTKQLLISGPFKYCRNPMSFGVLLHYLGMALWIGSFAAIVIVIICACLLILYIKQVEEHELERRFGQEYLDYKRNTPFFIPIIMLKDRHDDLP